MKTFLLAVCGLAAVVLLSTGCTSTASYERDTKQTAALDGKGKPIFNEEIKPVQIGDQIAYQTNRFAVTNVAENVTGRSKSLLSDKEIAGFKATTTDADGVKREISINSASSKPNPDAIEATGNAGSKTINSIGDAANKILNPAASLLQGGNATTTNSVPVNP